MKNLAEVREQISFVHDILNDLNEEISISTKKIVQIEKLKTTINDTLNPKIIADAFHIKNIKFLERKVENMRDKINDLQGNFQSYSLILNQLDNFFVEQEEISISEVERKAREKLKRF